MLALSLALMAALQVTLALLLALMLAIRQALACYAGREAVFVAKRCYRMGR